MRYQIRIGLALLAACVASVATVSAQWNLSDRGVAREEQSGIRGHGIVPQSFKSAMTIATEATRGNPSANRGASSSFKISASTMAGGVTAFAITPDGSTAVYLADQETLGRFELYSAPVDGSAGPIKISSALVFGTGDQGVSLFRITPDGGSVVFLADPVAGFGNDDLYSVPTTGSQAAVRLNTAGQTPVSGLGITPDGNSVGFFAPDSTTGSGAIELYSATVGSASSARQLSDAGATNGNGSVVAAIFAPDSGRAFYSADATSDDVFQWFSVSLGASGPGTDVQLSSALGFVTLGEATPDSATLVYTADESTLGVMEIYSTPASGGARTKLNPGMAGDGVSALEISPNGSRVVYLADQLTAGVSEVFGATVGVSASASRLNTPLGGTQFADVVTITPDGSTVLYEADENIIGTFDLLAVPIDGSALPMTLHALTPPDSAGFFAGRGTPVLGRRAVYPVFGSDVGLFSVLVDGSAGFDQINPPLAVGESLFNAFVPGGGSRLIAYGIGPNADSITSKLIVASSRADLTTQQVNVTSVSGDAGVMAYSITAGESHAVYVQDQDTIGKLELYAAELDSDGDGVGNGTDNCRFVNNPGQGLVVFGQVVRAIGNAFVWNNMADVRYVRGPLAAVGALTTDNVGNLAEAEEFVDDSTPAMGQGFYYLFAVDCAGGSYQTAIGAEPDRDLAGLP